MLTYGPMMIMSNKQEATLKMHMQKYLNLISYQFVSLLLHIPCTLTWENTSLSHRP